MMAVLALLLSSAPGAPPPATRALYAQILDALEGWDIDRAQALIGSLQASDGEGPVTEELRGRVRFFQGDYAGATALLQGSESNAAKLATASLAETSADDQRESAHFILRFPRGKDALLAPYALETLERARERIGGDLGFLPEGRIRVEILRDPAALSRLSPLTESEIETSGTIALCKYNKLMVVSPRALLTGYTWQDTLAHELTHYLITRKSENKTPIWLHEGIAKFEESRWRGAAGEALSPATAALLARRLQQGTLISFERMHPSIALLPSQEDAALAFAEVFTFIEFLTKERHASLEALLLGLRAGKSDTEAVALAAGEPFDRVTRAWKTYLRSRPMPKELLPLAPERLKFKEKGVEKRSATEELEADELSREIDDRSARRFAHLGSLLLARSRPVAALTELGKAESRVGARSPALSNLYAGVLLGAGREAEAERILRASLLPYPDIAQTHLHLAEVEIHAKQWDPARRELLAANAVDPFDPDIHAGLLKVAQATGDATAAALEQTSIALLAQP